MRNRDELRSAKILIVWLAFTLFFFKLTEGYVPEAYHPVSGMICLLVAFFVVFVIIQTMDWLKDQKLYRKPTEKDYEILKSLDENKKILILAGVLGTDESMESVCRGGKVSEDLVYSLLSCYDLGYPMHGKFDMYGIDIFKGFIQENPDGCQWIKGRGKKLRDYYEGHKVL